MPDNTIEKVIDRLKKTVLNAEESDNAQGIFAQLYLGITQQVRDGITSGKFENGKRMERLNVTFANRYLDAFENYHVGKTVTQSWQSAFDATKKNDLLIIQYLYMGVNTHLNLDLGIAASETVPADELPDLKNDFDEINTILINNIESLQIKLNKLSPILFLLDWAGKKSDGHLMEFSLITARSQAWSAALRLSKITNEHEKKQQITELDKYVVLLNKFIVDPGVIGSLLVKTIKWFEEKNAAKIIRQIR